MTSLFCRVELMTDKWLLDQGQAMSSVWHARPQGLQQLNMLRSTSQTLPEATEPARMLERKRVSLVHSASIGL